MCLSNICMQLWVMEMRLLDSSTLPPELWSCEPRYVKVSTRYEGLRDIKWPNWLGFWYSVLCFALLCFRMACFHLGSPSMPVHCTKPLQHCWDVMLPLPSQASVYCTIFHFITYLRQPEMSSFISGACTWCKWHEMTEEAFYHTNKSTFSAVHTVHWLQLPGYLL